jgi:uncharacterized protein (DUF2141 family)
MIWKMMFAASLSALVLTGARAADLTVTVDGIRNASGFVSAGIFNSESSFPKAAEALASVRVKAMPGSFGFTMHSLPPGRYAVVAYHDENANGQLDFDPIGQPAEGYGVSNDARNPAAPPEFAKAAFEVRDQKSAAPIHIVY